jgi:hypothetical protein
MCSVASWTPSLSAAADEYALCAEAHPGLGSRSVTGAVRPAMQGAEQ